jgi:hypothetical protein
MPEIHILVRGKARDFDDIYEGTKLEPIAKREELIALLSGRFGASKWERNTAYNNTWVGSSAIVPRAFELMVGNNEDVIMLKITGMEKNAVVSFSEELGLSILD